MMSSTHARNLYAIFTDGKIEFFSLGPDRLLPATPPDLIVGEADKLPRYERRFGSQGWCGHGTIEAIDRLAESMVDTALVVPGIVPAGYTYLAQFVFHDLSRLVINAGKKKNLTSAALDLDSVLGNRVSKAEPGEAGTLDALRIGCTHPGENNQTPIQHDVPRMPHDPPQPRHDEDCMGCPLIADIRNEGFLQLAQIHVAMMHFYNAVARKNGFGTDGYDKDAADKEFVQHVQSVVLYDLLKRLTDPAVYRDVVGNNKRRVIHPKEINDDDPFLIPLEFALAAARFGHSMVREQYDWNDQHSGTRPAYLETLITMSYQNTPANSPSFRQKLDYDWVIDWPRFFDLRAAPGRAPLAPDCANLMGPRIAPTMGALPAKIRAPGSGNSCEAEFNLAKETLRRQVYFRLSSAQQVICAMNYDLPDDMQITILTEREWATGGTPADLELMKHPKLISNTPIWYYILKEAQQRGGGDPLGPPGSLSTPFGSRLGPFGSRLVLETIHAAIASSGKLAITSEGGWTPTLPCVGDKFEMPDLIAFAHPKPIAAAAT